MKGALIKFSLFMTVIIIAIAAFLFFAPVSFDAGACGGGFKRWVSDAYSQQMLEVFFEQENVDTQSTKNYTIESRPEEIADSIDWKGRYIYATINIKYNNKAYSVNFIGKRYWIEKYKWEIQSINL